MSDQKSWTTIDKSGWGDGPWRDEPDKIQWVDDATDLDCLIVRGPSGALCGYVGVPPSHPWHGIDYPQCVEGGKGGACKEGWCDNTPESKIEVHGGLTFADSCRETDDESTGICHVPLPGRDADVWWFGFDCAHLDDATPRYSSDEYLLDFSNETDEYRTVEYVQAEVESLAEQLVSP